MSDKLDKIKKHFSDHKDFYIGVAVGAGVCVAGYLVYKSRHSPTITNIVAPVISPVFNNDSSVNFGGYSHKLVKCIETGEIWETVKEAAAAMGVQPTMMSKHLNGHTDNISGLNFKIIGLGTM